VFRFLHAALAAAPAARHPKLRLLGPAPAAMARRAGRHRAQLLVDSASRGTLQDFLGQWIPLVASMRAPRALRWSVDVDPLEVD
jgi:primosomal protein N' (replication factor Y)